MSNKSSESDKISSTEDIELTEYARSSAHSNSSADYTASCRRSIKQRGTSEEKSNDVIEFLNCSEKNHREFNIERVSLGSVEGLPHLNRRKSLSDGQSSVSTRKTSTLEELQKRMVSSLDSLKEPSSKKLISLNSLERPSTKRVLSLDSIRRPSTERVSSLDPLEGPSTRRVSSLDPLEGPSTRRVSSLDPLEGPSTRRVSSLDPLEGPSTRRVSSLDPLEGPSTRRIWFSDSAEDSLSSICKSHNTETRTETYEPSNIEPPTEENGYCFRILTWLSSFLRRYSRQIRHSKYYPLFYLALLAIPCSAGYMGSKYVHLCHGCPKLPFLVYMMGILGLWIIIIRIAAMLSKRYFAPPLTGHEFNSCMVVLVLPFFLFLIIEMATTYICEPVFIPSHEEFCIKVFYNYAYNLNMIVPLVILLLLLIYIPGYFDPAEAE